jgi:hypothetical protein
MIQCRAAAGSMTSSIAPPQLPRQAMAFPMCYMIPMCYVSGDFREGLDAFLNKRAPNRQGAQE